MPKDGVKPPSANELHTSKRAAPPALADNADSIVSIHTSNILIRFCKGETC